MTTKQSNQRAFNICQCGCYAEIGPKSRYAPGHDARHVAELYRRMVEAMDREVSWYERGTHYKNAIAQLESPALKAKFRKRVADAGWKFHTNAAESMMNQWFSQRLAGLVVGNGDRTFEGHERVAAGILAVLGFDRAKVNYKYS